MKVVTPVLVDEVARGYIITHPAPYHADEIIAIATLMIRFDVARYADVYRTRNLQEITEAEAHGAYIVDVGGVYDPDRRRFDHHQKEFSEVRPDGTKYASAGLLWKEYGVQACMKETGCTEAQAIVAAEKVDEILIKGIDAADYGERTEGQMSVSQVISVLNTNWDESATDTDEAFIDACRLAHLVLDRTIKSCVAQVKGRDAVEEAIEAAEGHIVVLPQFIGGWIQMVQVTDNPKGEELLYGVFRNLQGQWNVQAIPPIGNPQAQRKPLPEAWRGLNGVALAEVTGVEDAVFCHAGGFICGARSQEGAMKLAELAVEARFCQGDCETCCCCPHRR